MKLHKNEKLKDLNVSEVVKISVLHVILLSMTVIGLKSHVTILPGILEFSKRDGWISVLIALVLVIPWLYFVWRINRKESLPYTWKMSSSLYERVGIVVVIILLYLLAASTMIEMLQWVKTTFMPITPMLILLVLYLILCVSFASLGIQTIVVVNVLVLFVVIVLGFFVAIVNIQYKDYSLLLPILENGWLPPLSASFLPLSGFMELLLFLLVQQYFKTPLQLKYYILIVMLLAGLTLGPLIGAIVEFGPEEASLKRYPAFEQWGLAALGDFIDHMDFFSIYQWMTGAFVRIGFYLFVVSKLMGIQQRTKEIWYYIAIPFALVCLGMLLLDEQTFLILNNILLPYLTIGILLLMPILLAVRSKKRASS